MNVAHPATWRLGGCAGDLQHLTRERKSATGGLAAAADRGIIWRAGADDDEHYVYAIALR